ncbi:MAG: hypothetical protein J6Y20_05630 [Lachnospiraceae bacterium]|nr:hypothetical protein [Lachnospiraceae bacterium]
MLEAILKNLAIIVISLLSILGGFSLLAASRAVSEKRKKEESVDVSGKNIDTEVNGKLSAHREEISKLLTNLDEVHRQLSVLNDLINSKEGEINDIWEHIQKIENNLTKNENK